MSVEVLVSGDGGFEGPRQLRDARPVLRGGQGVAWVRVVEPTEEELTGVARELGLRGPAAEHALAHGRVGLERHGGCASLWLAPALYVDGTESVEFGELRVYVEEGFAVTVSRGEGPDLEEVRRELEAEPDLLRSGGALSVLFAVLRQVVRDYGLVVEGLGNDVAQVEAEVLGGDGEATKRIYRLSREVVAFHRAVGPLDDAAERLVVYGMDPEFRGRLRVVRDRALRLEQKAGGYVSALQNLLSVNLTLVAVRQNDQTRAISAWAAILVVPTVVGSIYGMNFRAVALVMAWVLVKLVFGIAGALFHLLLVAAVVVLVYNFTRPGARPRQ